MNLKKAKQAIAKEKKRLETPIFIDVELGGETVRLWGKYLSPWSPRMLAAVERHSEGDDVGAEMENPASAVMRRVYAEEVIDRWEGMDEEPKQENVSAFLEMLTDEDWIRVFTRFQNVKAITETEVKEAAKN